MGGAAVETVDASAGLGTRPPAFRQVVEVLVFRMCAGSHLIQ